MSNKTPAANLVTAAINNTAAMKEGQELSVEIHAAPGVNVGDVVNDALNETKETEVEVTEVKAPSKLKAAKSKFKTEAFWTGVIAATAITAIGTGVNMVVVNKLIDELDLDHAKYTGMEIAGVTAVAALTGGALQAGIQAASDRITYNDTNQMMSVSLVANATMLTTAFLRDKALNAIKGTASAELLTEEELAETEAA